MRMPYLFSLGVAVIYLVIVDGFHLEWYQEMQNSWTGRLEAMDVGSSYNFVAVYNSSAIFNAKWEDYLRALHTVIIWCGRLTTEGKTASFTLDLGKIPNRVHLNWNYRAFNKAMDFFNELTFRSPMGYWLKNILNDLMKIETVEQFMNADYKSAGEGMKRYAIAKVEMFLKSAAKQSETIIEIALKIQENITAKAEVLREIAAGLPDSESAENSRSILQVLNEEMPKLVEFWTDFNQLLQTLAIYSQITVHYGLEESKQYLKISSVKTSNSSTIETNLKIIKTFATESFKAHFLAYLFTSKLRQASDQIISVYYSRKNFASPKTDYMKQIQQAANAVPYLINGRKDAAAKMKAIQDALKNLYTT